MKKIFSTVIAVALAALTFTSCEDVPMPYDYPGTGGGEETPTIEPTGDGTMANPYNIAALNDYASSLESGQTSPDQKYFKGKVVSIKEAPGNSYGNATFYLSDDGTTKNQFYVYRCYGPGNKKFTAADENMFTIGDEVLVCGTITNYNGTLETEQNKAYVVSVNGEGGTNNPGTNVDPKGTGTAADPFNVAAAIAKCTETGETATTDVYYVQGVAKTIDASGAGQYGNITIDMTDEGGSDVFKAFQIVSFNGAKFTEASVASTVKEGDLIVVKGNLVNYKNNTPETTGKGAAQLVSVNGVGGGDTPDTPDIPQGEAKGDGTKDNPFNAVAAIKFASNLAADAKSDPVYIKGKVSRTKDISVQYKNATFYISEDGTQKDEFYVFRCKGLDNTDIASADDVMVGDDVVIYGPVVNYNGNTPETVQNEAYIYSITHNGTPGGDDNPSTGGDVTPGDANVSLVMANVYSECTNGSVDAGTKTVNGITMAFAQNDGNNPPKYYWNATPAYCSVRMYAKNSVEIKADQTISKVVFTCAAGSGSTNYNGNPTMTTTKGSITKASDNVTVTVDGINSNSFTLTNEHTATSSGVQFRIVKMDVYYATSSAKAKRVRK